MKHGKGSKKESASKNTSKSGRKAEKQSSPKKVSSAEKGSAPKRAVGPSAGTEARRADVRGGGKPGPVSFSNPAVGNAFRRAVKKYGAALKRLTD